MSFGLEIQLLDDVVFSADAATTGGHRALDHVPGAALLGWAAGILHATLSPEEAWDVFHSGRVRFGNGYPLLADGAVAYPAPLSFHAPKGMSGAAREAALRNLPVGSFAPGVQPQQLRGGFRTEQGQPVSTRSAYRLKTAINPDTGRAAEAQLFGYTALERDQVFMARVDIDTDVDPDLLERVKMAFAGRELRLGRSRAGEYGAARARITDLPDLPAVRSTDEGGEAVTVWALSDLRLTDRFGQPTFCPDPVMFGLQGYAFDELGSFLQTRDYAVFNAALGGHETAGFYIQRGSVMRFRRTDAGSARILNSYGWAGLSQERGQGLYIINPLLLEADRLPATAMDPVVLPALTNAATMTADQHLYLATVRSWVGRTDNPVQDWALRKADELERLYGAARSWAGLEPGALVGPSASQWGTVFETARQASDIDRLKRALFEGKNPVCRDMTNTQLPQWTAMTALPDGKLVKFDVWLRREVEAQAETDAGLALARMQAFAREARATVRRMVQS